MYISCWKYRAAEDGSIPFQFSRRYLSTALLYKYGEEVLSFVYLLSLK